MDEILVVYACYEGVDDIGLRDLVKRILGLVEATDVVAQAFVRLTLATREFPCRAGLCVSPLKVVMKFTLKVAPSADEAFAQVV